MATNCLHTSMPQLHFPANAFKDFIHYSINLKFRTLSSKSGPDMDQGPVVQYLKCSVAQLCPTVCDPIDCSTPGFPVHHQLQERAQTQVHWVADAIQPSHPLPSFSCLQSFPHQSLLQGVSSSHQVTKVLELQLQHHSFQWICRTDLLRIDWFDLLAVQETLESSPTQ